MIEQFVFLIKNLELLEVIFFFYHVYFSNFRYETIVCEFYFSGFMNL